MSYKIEYFKLVRDTPSLRDIHTIFDKQNLTSAESELIVDYAEQQKAAPFYLRVSLCEYLLEINSPRAIQLLRDDYFDIVIRQHQILEECHRIEDDAFQDKLANYARNNLKQGHAGRVVNVGHVLKALARTNEERFVELLAEFIETHSSDLTQLNTNGWKLGISALEALSLMTHPTAQSIAQKWLTYWHDYIRHKLENTAVKILNYIYQKYLFLYCQQPVVDMVFDLLPDASKQEYKDLLRLMYHSHRNHPRRKEILTRLLTFARDCEQYFLRKQIFEALKSEDHPMLCELATQYALERPLTYMTELCVSILQTQKYVSRELAQHLLSELETHPYLRTKWGLQDFALTYLDYLTMMDDPHIDAAIMRFIREHESPNLKPSRRYKIVAKIAHRHDDGFQYILESIDHHDETVQRGAVRSLAQTGKRGIPIMRSLLEGTHSTQPTLLHALNKTHASLMPLLVDLAMRQPNMYKSIKYALRRLDTEDAYEALCVFARGDIPIPPNR